MVEAVWTTKMKVIDKCEICDDIESLVSIDCEVWEKVKAMSTEMGNKEWLGYLIGTIDKEAEVYYINDIYVPTQEVSYASVDVGKDDAVEGIVGTIHSHHTMGAFHSATDKDFVGSNHDVCIVYSNKGSVAKVRQHLPCGHCVLIDADLVIRYPTVQDVDAFVKDSRTRIKDKTYTYKKPAEPIVYKNGIPQPQQALDLKQTTEERRQEIVEGVFCDYCGYAFVKSILVEYEEMQLCPECLEWAKHWGMGY